MANRPTHTVRTVSRRVESVTDNSKDGDSLNDDFSAAPRTIEAKKNLMRRMLMVFGVVIVLLVLLLIFDFLSERRATGTPASLQPSQPTEVPTINLDKVDDLKTRLDAAQEQVSKQQPEQQPAQTQESSASDGVSPYRTPFDDLNFVEEPEEQPVDPNAPIVEQTVTETGETILRISPQRSRVAANQPRQQNQTQQQNAQRQQIQQIQQYQKNQQRRNALARVEAENSSNIPMQGRMDSGLPTSGASHTVTRMPSNRFHVQAGIFMENNRARALYQRLVSAGIPTVVESRVQVGPFTTRREAEVARQQLKSMGIDSIVVAPSS